MPDMLDVHILKKQRLSNLVAVFLLIYGLTIKKECLRFCLNN